MVGVDNVDKIRKEIFDTLNNRSIVSKNILTDKNVEVIKIKEKNIILINIPEASYKDKPIYLREQLNLAYKRNHEGDYKCTEEEVRILIRNSSLESMDNQALENFGIDDLDKETLRKYRQRFANLKPEHPFNDLKDEEFLIKIGGMKKNREKKLIELTLAGLLVFGKSECIREVLPHFHLEYLDKRVDGSERWSDRVIYDGTWGEGNLYNFFQLVIQKIYNSLEKDFKISKDMITREENSSIQIALREILVNTLIHADFKIEEPIKIIRYNNYFEFENPGGLRITKEQFYKGEYSKPRNEHIQLIFRMINLCERAGSGIPKVLKAVREKEFRFPEIESSDRKFIFKFWNISLIQNMKLDTEEEKKVMEYVIKNLKITNLKAREELGLTKHTATDTFNNLLNKDYLERKGSGKGIYYILRCSEEENRTRFLGQVLDIVEFLKKEI